MTPFILPRFGHAATAATLAATLGDATLASAVTRTTPSPSDAALAATLDAATLASAVASVAPGNAAATMSATLADVTLTSSVTASAAGTVTGTLAQTLADATLTSAVVRTLPGNTTADLGGAGDQITETFSGTLDNWTEHPNFTSGAFTITAAGRLRTNANGVNSAIYHATVPASADQEVRATFRPVSLVASDQLQVILRADTTATTWYELGHIVGTGWLIRRRVNGTLSTIAAGDGSTLTVGQDYAVVAKVTGTSLELIVDGVTVRSGTDSNISATGRVGVRGFQTTTSDSVGLHLDDFRLIGSGTPVVLDAVGLSSSVAIAVAGATASLSATLDAATLAGAATAGTPAGSTATLAATLDAVGLVSVVAAALTEGPTQITSTLTVAGPDSSTLAAVGATRTVIVQAGPSSTTFGAA